VGVGRKLAAAALASLALSACAAPEVPKEQYFRLVATMAAGKIVHPLSGIVEAQPFSADGVTGERPLLFTDNGGTKLEQRNYAYWVNPPIQMLRDQMIAYLRSAGLAEQVVPSELRSEAGYRIQGDIKRLEQSIDGKKSSGVIELELSVIDESSDQIILSKVYHAEKPATDGTIDASVAALNAGLQDVLKQFVADIDAR
jgi:cholesterol transport system auxiliary component